MSSGRVATSVVERQGQWQAIYVRGETVTKACGCQMSEQTWRLCDDHHAAFIASIAEDEQ